MDISASKDLLDMMGAAVMRFTVKVLLKEKKAVIKIERKVEWGARNLTSDLAIDRVVTGLLTNLSTQILSQAVRNAPCRDLLMFEWICWNKTRTYGKNFLMQREGWE